MHGVHFFLIHRATFLYRFPPDRLLCSRTFQCLPDVNIFYVRLSLVLRARHGRVHSECTVYWRGMSFDLLVHLQMTSRSNNSIIVEAKYTIQQLETTATPSQKDQIVPFTIWNHRSHRVRLNKCISKSEEFYAEDFWYSQSPRNYSSQNIRQIYRINWQVGEFIMRVKLYFKYKVFMEIF